MNQVIHQHFHSSNFKPLYSFSTVTNTGSKYGLNIAFSDITWITTELESFQCFRVSLWKMTNLKSTCRKKILTYNKKIQELRKRRAEWSGLESTFNNHLVQPSCLEQWHFSLVQATQRSNQPDLKQFQGWGNHTFSEQPAPASHHPHCEEFLPYI